MEFNGIEEDERFTILGEELSDKEIENLLKELGISPTNKPKDSTEFHLLDQHDQRSHGAWSSQAQIDNLPPQERRLLAKESDKDLRNAVSTLLVSRRKIEPKYTKMLSDIATDNKGKMVGLEHKFKEGDVVFDKVQRRARDKGVSPTEATKGFGDALRYTMVYSPENYVSGVKETVDNIQKQEGVEFKQIESSWGKGDDYNGLNSIFKDQQTGLRVELQFHTPETFRIKESKMHRNDYEFVRARRGTHEHRQLRFNRMRDRFDNINFPSGIDNLCSNLPSGLCVEKTRSLTAAGSVKRIPVDTMDQIEELLRQGKASLQDWEEFIDATFGMGPIWSGSILENIDAKGDGK